MTYPVVSIITPSFNRAAIVHETAESIFQQAYPHWEWVITDDGSTDDSWQVLESFAAQDSRVKIYKRDREPKGACTCRNISVERSSGKYLLFLDTDDLLAPYCLEQRVKAAEESADCDFVIFPMLLFKQRPDDLRLLWNVDKNDNDIHRLLFGDAICQGTGTIWKKSAFQAIGGWDESLLLWQDVELHLRALINGVSYKKRMDLKPDIFLRISDISLSRTGYHSLPKLQSRIKIFGSITEAIAGKGWLKTYYDGLKNMLVDLYINALQGGYFHLANHLLDLSRKFALATQGEENRLKQILVMHRLKLNKIPGARKYFLSQVLQMKPVYESTLCKMPYLEKIA